MQAPRDNRKIPIEINSDQIFKCIRMKEPRQICEKIFGQILT